jgi:hypothetical protein
MKPVRSRLRCFNAAATAKFGDPMTYLASLTFLLTAGGFMLVGIVLGHLATASDANLYGWDRTRPRGITRFEWDEMQRGVLKGAWGDIQP